MKTSLLFFFLLLLTGMGIHAQDVESLLSEGKRLEDSFKEEQAIQKYQEVLRIQPVNSKALVACSELSARIGNRQTNKNSQVSYFNAAESYAGTALKVDSNNARAHVAMAVAQGRMALVKSGKEKVAHVREIKRFAENALKLDPKNAIAWHVLGKWHLEVSNLNAVERAAAKVLFGGIPKASVQEAIQAFEKARQLDSWFVLNYLELAKAYKENGQSDKAIDTLNRMLKLPTKTQDDPRWKAEGKKLLDSLL